jgi:membrane protease YdiL (CAAX protease family)
VPSPVLRVLRFPLTRLIIALVVMLVLALGMSRLVRYLAHVAPSDPPRSQLIFAIASVGALLFVGKVVERRPIAALGLRPHGAAQETLAGFGLGALLMSVVIGSMVVAGWYHIERLGGAPAALLGALGLLLLVAIAEEVVMRGLVFRIVEEWLGSVLALLISALLFGLGHILNPNSSVMAMIAIAIEAGILLGAAYMLTRSLWLPIGIHWSWNFVEGPVFGTPVSGVSLAGTGVAVEQGPDLFTGGAFGPEAGLIAVLLCGGAGVVLIRQAVVKGRVMTPPWLRRLTSSLSGSVNATSEREDG